MEIVDNAIMLVIPGAMDAGLASPLFWGSLAFSLAVAAVAAFPVNRWLIARGKGHAVVHAHHSQYIEMRRMGTCAANRAQNQCVTMPAECLSLSSGLLAVLLLALTIPVQGMAAVTGAQCMALAHHEDGGRAGKPRSRPR